MKLHSIRVAVVLMTAAIFTSAAPARAQLIASDGFGNGPLSDLAGSTGGTGWTSAWASVSDDLTKVAGPGLSYPGLVTTPGGAVTPPANGVWPSSVYQRSFGALPADTNAIYVSFLMRDDAAWGIWGGLSFGQYPNEMTVGSPLGWYTYGLMLSEGLGDTASKPLIQGETTLVVVKISKNTPAAGTTYRMYLDPVIGSPEPGFPAVQYGVGVSALPTSLSIDNGTGFTTDEIRVGTTWASVLPAEVSAWSDLGFGKPGSVGVPSLVGTGPLSADSANEILLSNAQSHALATLVLSLDLVNLPIKGGILVPAPDAFFALGTSATGTVSVPFILPRDIGAGVPVRLQYWIQDAGATYGLSASNGLQGVTQ